MTEAITSTQDAEVAITKHLYERIARMGQDDLPGVTVWGQALRAFCGDLVLSAPRPSGGINILLGDFVGKGLPAAVGGLPVAEVFYGMTEKGFGLSDIIEELNKKLLFVLPDDLFCSACLIEIEHEGKVVAVWNGGLPDLLIIDQDSNIKHRVPSAHIPLGIKKTNKKDLETGFIEVEAGDKIFCYSDGLENAINLQKQTFGQEKIEHVLQQDNKLSTLSCTIENHILDAPQQDDMTLLELDIAAIQNFDVSTLNTNTQLSLPPSQWQIEIDFSAQVLKHLDLVPLLINMLMQIQAPHEHKQRIYTVLAEMCSNALEHGVLKLDSNIKQNANGFADYYALRSQRLAGLEAAYMKVSLQHEPYQQGGKLIIRVEDSGDGFDYQQYVKDLADNKEFCGRGQGLLQQLCTEYYFSGKGNIAHATYIWTA